MAYSYDQPLKVQYNFGTFQATSTVALAASMAAEGGDRQLEGSVLLGIAGVVGATPGDLTIKIGDGVDATRYGTFVLDSNLSTGDVISGKLNLTEEGYHMSVSNVPNTPKTFTLTAEGAAILNLVFVIGYY